MTFGQERSSFVNPQPSIVTAGEDPLAFVKQQIRPATPSEPKRFTADSPEGAAFIAEKVIQHNASANSVNVVVAEIPKAETKPAQSPITESTVKPTIPVTEESGELLESVKPNKEDSVRQLAKKIKTYETDLKTKETELEEARGKLKAYQSGEAIPEVVSRMSAEIEGHKKWQEKHNFKFSDAYKTRIVDPQVRLKGELENLAKEYEMPSEKLLSAVNIKNKRERNSYLLEHFDVLGAQTALGLLDQFQAVKEDEAAFERADTNSLEAWNEQYQEHFAASENERVGKLNVGATSGWQEAVTELSAGDYPEFVIKDGNEEHNQYSRPILEGASQEFGKFVNMLGALGMKDLPKEAAKILAKRFLLSQAAPVVAADRATYAKDYNDLLGTTNRRSKLNRVPVGGMTRGGDGEATLAKPVDAKAAADILMRKVGIL